MFDDRLKPTDARRGAAFVEFALFSPLLLMLCLAATDFGRIFFAAITVCHAAGTGALFGAQDNISAGDYGGIQQRVTQDAEDVPTVTTTPSQYCGCPDGTQIACSEILVNDCPGYGSPRAYIRVRAAHTFDPLVDYPGLPSDTAVGQRAWMRVQ